MVGYEIQAPRCRHGMVDSDENPRLAGFWSLHENVRTDADPWSPLVAAQSNSSAGRLAYTGITNANEIPGMGYKWSHMLPEGQEQAVTAAFRHTGVHSHDLLSPGLRKRRRSLRTSSEIQIVTYRSHHGHKEKVAEFGFVRECTVDRTGLHIWTVHRMLDVGAGRTKGL